VSPAGVPLGHGATTPVRHRRSVRSLTAGQVTDLRSAVHKAQGISDDRGFQAWAGVHGLPLPISCTHHNHLFLPWHRAYLYLFEKALQDRVGGVTLPWWDWTAKQAEGIPPAYAHPHVPGSGGANPLFDSEIQPSGRRDPSEQRTWRQPGRDGALPTAAEVEQVLRNRDFFTFQAQLESLHDGVHVWVGGTMGDISVAAYDPVFWAHHTMIDRVWALWQLRHPGAGPPASLLNQALAPFPMTVKDTLEIAHLGYDYAVGTTAAQGPGHHG
jgi:tyrosinase